MKNYLDSKLSEEVKEIIGSTLANYHLPRHNQHPSRQVFKILRPTRNEPDTPTPKIVLPSSKPENCRPDKENQDFTQIKKRKNQQGVAQELKKDDCYFDSIWNQRKQTQQGIDWKKSIKDSALLSKKSSLKIIASLNRTPEKKAVQAIRGESAARAIHSLLPSPHITPKKSEGKKQKKEEKEKNGMNSSYQASSAKKIFIGLVSASLTPNRSPLKASK